MAKAFVPSPGVLRCGGREFRWGERTYVMGIINVTPDSFSGDGIGGDVDAAIAQGVRFVEEGADILDVGGESTRPPTTARTEAQRFGAPVQTARPVSVEEEVQRVIPVIQGLIKVVDVPISVDSYKSAVVRQAIEAGASMVNDVWGLKRDPAIAQVASEAGAPLVLMHNQEGTIYNDLLGDIFASLQKSAEVALVAGVPREHIILDIGFGFGKTARQNLELLRHLDYFRALSFPLLLGTSRKSTIGYVLDLPVDQRMEGTAATVAIGIAKGADIVRVHDVLAMARVARMTDAIVRRAPDHLPG